MFSRDRGPLTNVGMSSNLGIIRATTSNDFALPNRRHRHFVFVAAPSKCGAFGHRCRGVRGGRSNCSFNLVPCDKQVHGGNSRECVRVTSARVFGARGRTS